MRITYAKALLAHHAKDAFTVISSLVDTISLARSLHHEAYIEQCKHRNVLTDFKTELFECTSKESEIRDIPLWANHFLTAHYLALAEGCSEPEKTCYTKQANEAKEETIKRNAFFAHVLLGVEYVLDGIIKADKELALYHLERAFKGGFVWKDLSNEMREKCLQLMSVVKNKIDQSTEAKEWSTKVSQLWKDFSGNPL